MKHFSIFPLLLALLLMLTACGGNVPVMTGTDTETEAETETEVETEPPVPKKRVAITFDDGPAYDNASVQRLTYKIVDEFKKYGGAATFFLVGNRINGATGEAIRYAHDNGCELAIHAYTHNIYFDDCPEQEFLNEIHQTENAIHKYVPNARIALLRAPGGYITRERAAMVGYPVINWSIDTEDWRHKSRSDDVTAKANIDAIVENALRGVEDGDILLLHEIYQNSYEATCIILQRLDEMGFAFVTVSELFGENALTPGATYYSAP